MGLRTIVQRRAALVPALALTLGLAGCASNATVTGLVFSTSESDSFTVGAGDTLWIESFAGRVDVRPGADHVVAVPATRRAARRADLPRISVVMEPSPGGVRVVTQNPDKVENASVDLTITASPDLHPVIMSGVGDARYEGRPSGGWMFSVGVGDLTLAMPADVGVTVALSVGTGSIASDFTVTGVTTALTMNGTIGSGLEGSIVGNVGVGTIHLVAQ